MCLLHIVLNVELHNVNLFAAHFKTWIKYGSIWIRERHPQYLEAGHANHKRSHGEMAKEG